MFQQQGWVMDVQKRWPRRPFHDRRYVLLLRSSQEALVVVHADSNVRKASTTRVSSAYKWERRQRDLAV
ncbi:unnamed protein product [Victoria cruziana]